MRHSKTLAKIRAQKPIRLCSLGHFIPAFIRHAAHFGYDCIWLDLEHRAMSDREVQSLLAHFHLFDIDCLLRVPTREKVRIYRYLEDGATGIMVPHVSTVEEAESLVKAVKFPPIGERGIDAAGLDSDYTLAGDADYTDRANEQTFLVLQMESPQAIDNVDAIAAVEGVDALFVGTGDLGLRIRKSDTHLNLETALADVAQAAKRHGKVWGCPAGSPEHLQRLHDQGAQLIAYGGEFFAIMEMLRRSSGELDEVYGRMTIDH